MLCNPGESKFNFIDSQNPIMCYHLKTKYEFQKALASNIAIYLMSDVSFLQFSMLSIFLLVTWIKKERRRNCVAFQKCTIAF